MCVSKADSCRFPKVGTIRCGARILRRVPRLIECRGFLRPLSLFATVAARTTNWAGGTILSVQLQALLQLKRRARRLKRARGWAGLAEIPETCLYITSYFVF
jgi:hypothetical protein